MLGLFAGPHSRNVEIWGRSLAGLARRCRGLTGAHALKILKPLFAIYGSGIAGTFGWLFFTLSGTAACSSGTRHCRGPERARHTDSARSPVVCFHGQEPAGPSRPGRRGNERGLARAKGAVMRAVLLVAAVALVLVSCTPVAKAMEHSTFTALEMVSYCKSVAESQPISGGKLSIESTFEAGRCWGFFEAIQKAMLLIYVSGTSGLLLGVCLPSEVSVPQLVLIFRRYVEVNPSVILKDVFFVTKVALEEAYTCKG